MSGRWRRRAGRPGRGVVSGARDREQRGQQADADSRCEREATAAEDGRPSSATRTTGGRPPRAPRPSTATPGPRAATPSAPAASARTRFSRRPGPPAGATSHRGRRASRTRAAACSSRARKELPAFAQPMSRRIARSRSRGAAAAHRARRRAGPSAAGPRVRIPGRSPDRRAAIFAPRPATSSRACATDTAAFRRARAPRIAPARSSDRTGRQDLVREPERNPRLDRLPQLLLGRSVAEFRRRDADDRERAVVQDELGSDESRRTAELPLPDVMRENDDRIGIHVAVLRRPEGASDLRRRPRSSRYAGATQFTFRRTGSCPPESASAPYAW